jgi:hypothetical protein
MCEAFGCYGMNSVGRDRVEWAVGEDRDMK